MNKFLIIFFGIIGLFVLLFIICFLVSSVITIITPTASTVGTTTTTTAAKTAATATISSTTMINDPNYQAVVNSFLNNSFGSARNTAIVITQNQANALYPLMAGINLQGLSDPQLYNLLTCTTTVQFQSYLQSYYPNNGF